MKRSVRLAVLLGGILFAESSHAQELMPNGSFENDETGGYVWSYWGSAKRDIGLARTGNYSARVNLQGLRGAIIRPVAIQSTGTYRFSFYHRTVGQGTVETKALIKNVTLCEDKARKETSDFAPCEAEVNLTAGVTIVLFKATAGGSGTPAWMVDDVSLVPK